MDKRELINRALELVALADKATPGSWGWCGNRLVVVGPGGKPEVPYRQILEAKDGPYSEHDRKLLAVAWDMARLLRQLADALEEVLNDRRDANE